MRDMLFRPERRTRFANGAITLLVSFIVAIPGVAAEDDRADVVIRIEDAGDPVIEEASGAIVLAESRPGARYAWNLSLTDRYTIVEVRVHGAFDVERPQQVVPFLDGDHFVELYAFDVVEVDEPERVARASGDGRAFAWRLGVPGPGNFSLVLERDVTPPSFELDEVQALAHRSFLLETRTNEPVLADLRVRPVDGEEWVRFPTPFHAVLQRFPVQGLKPDREYAVEVDFEDWSGNAVSSEPFHVRTLPEPERPKPVIEILEPRAGATASAPVEIVRARIESLESPLVPSSVRLFVDKREVHSGFTIDNGTFVYVPDAPLGPGHHSLSVEARNEAGGHVVERASFTVEAARVGGAGALAFVAVALGAGLARRR